MVQAASREVEYCRLQTKWAADPKGQRGLAEGGGRLDAMPKMRTRNGKGGA